MANAPTSRGESLVGRVLLGRYELVELLGRGPVGEVYRAHNARLRRDAAIKVLRSGSSEVLLREAQLTAKVQHRNVVDIWDTGTTDDGLPFIVMELVDGESLAARLVRQGALPVVEVFAIARQIFIGLGAAHAVGVVHSDVKPENVILAEDDTVKLVDFGIGRAHADDETLRVEAGALAGAPRYLSPEQVRGAEVDGATDAWSATVVLYEMLTGTVPFDGPTIDAIVDAVLSAEPTPPSQLRPGLTAGFDDLMRLGLKKDPGKRTDVHVMLACLQGVAQQSAGGGFTDTVEGDPAFLDSRPPEAADTQEFVPFEDYDEETTS